MTYTEYCSFCGYAKEGGYCHCDTNKKPLNTLYIVQESEGRDILITSKAQAAILAVLRQGAEVIRPAYSLFGRLAKMPVSTVFEQWRNICKNNKVEIFVMINGHKVAAIRQSGARKDEIEHKD